MDGSAKRKRSDNDNDGDSTPNSNNSNPGPSLDALVSPNLEELARQFPDFGRAWNQLRQARHDAAASQQQLPPSITQDFTISLTKSLLQAHFGISLTQIPLNHLCPPVPNRFFYVQWMQQELLPLLKSPRCFAQPTLSAIDGKTTASTAGMDSVLGLDIGTGATCIYPLLFAAFTKRVASSQQGQVQRQQLRVYATEVDPESLQMALQNVRDNGLDSCIRSLLVPPSSAQQLKAAETKATAILDSSRGTNDNNNNKGPLWTSLQCLPAQDRALHFCMTNPPFYDDDDNDDDGGGGKSHERTARRAGDGRHRTAMTVSEGSYPGGEVGFVLDMMVDGLLLHLGQQQQQQQQQSESKSLHPPPPPPGWSSCMCGKKESWIKLKHIAEQLLGYSHVKAAEFGPGHMTRWFLAWTFQRPQIQSPLALTESWSFSVELQENDDDDGDIVVEDHNNSSVNLLLVPACDRVSGRVRTFLQECFPKQAFVCSVVEELPAHEHEHEHKREREHKRLVIHEQRSADNTSWVGDDALPEQLQQIIRSTRNHNNNSPMQQQQRSHFLPPEGHLEVQVSLMAKVAPPMSSSSSSRGSRQVVVQVTASAFSHTRHGKMTVDKIRVQMQGEVCRTNRKWRRKLKRIQQQQQQQEQVAGHHDPMDES